MGFCVEYESFSFEPMITDYIHENSKFKFVESGIFVIITIDLDQTLENVKIKRLKDLGSINLRRHLILGDHISRPMTHLLANFEHVYLFSNWAEQFGKLKRALICVALMLWMYSIEH